MRTEGAGATSFLGRQLTCYTHTYQTGNGGRPVVWRDGKKSRDEARRHTAATGDSCQQRMPILHRGTALSIDDDIARTSDGNSTIKCACGLVRNILTLSRNSYGLHPARLSSNAYQRRQFSRVASHHSNT